MKHFYPLHRAFFVVTAKKKLLLVFFLLVVNIITAQPVIQSFTPTVGPIGTTVTITGNNFSPVLANNIVRFGAVKAVVTAASTTSLSVVVPPGASYGPISVTANNLTAVSAFPYQTRFPGNINTFSDESFLKEASVITQGYNIAPLLMDLNEDGKPDLIAVDEINGGISFLKNIGTNGNVAFESRVNIISGVQANDLRTSDIDNDGKMDIIYPLTSLRAFAVHRNLSTASGLAFGTAVIFTTSDPEKINSLSIGDVNGDGKPDILVGYNYPSTQLSIFKNAGSMGNISFDPAVAIDMTGNSSSICIQDLDGDNLPEVAITTFTSNTINIIRNTSANGSISFDPVVKFPSAAWSNNISSADFDGDGKMDIVVGRTSSYAQFSIFRNISTSGNISFETKKEIPTGFYPSSISINDFDGDGKPDILVANPNELYTSLFRNRSISGNIGFFAAVNYSTTRQARGITSGDITSDGKPEFIALIEGQKVEIFRNRLGEPFLSGFSPASGYKGSVITISGKNFTGASSLRFGGNAAASFKVINSTTIEAVVAGGASGDISVTTSAGRGSIPGFLFIPAPTVLSISDSIGTKGSEIIIDGKNFNNATNVSFGGVAASSFTVVSDTRIKAVLGVGATGIVEVITPAGKGSLAGITYIRETDPYIVSFTPDIATQGQTVTINGLNFTGTTSVSFGGMAANAFTVVSASKIIATVDAGNSGALNVTTATGTATISGFTYGTASIPSISSFAPLFARAGEQVTIYGSNFSNLPSNNIVLFGPVQGKVINTSPTSLTVIVPTSAACKPISIITNGYSAQSRLSFSLAFEAGGITPTTQDFKSSFSTSIAFSPEDAQTHDLDGDLKPDIGVINEGMYVDLYRNVSTEQGISFTRKRLPISNYEGLPVNLKIADLDNDGKSDLIIADKWASRIVTLKNKSNPGTFSFDYPEPVSNIYTGRAFSNLSVGDIDLDGKVDIVAADNHPNSVYIYQNISTAGYINFTDGIDMNVGRYVSSTLLQDIDGDGKSDLILSSNLSNNITILRNISSPGNFQFAPPVELTLHFGAFNVVVADYDGDGKPDLSNSLSFLRNTSSPGTISFDTRLDLPRTGNITVRGVTDLDGDGKVDIFYWDGSAVGVMKNNSSTGNISFSQGGVYAVQLNAYLAGSCDYDGDGKPDLAVANNHGSNSQLVLFKNTMGEALVVPSGTRPVSGNVIQKLFLDPVVQTHNGKPFVQRHYDINPVNNPTTSTATITLYYTQAEFDNYNAHPAHGLPLPINPTDQLGKANLRIYQYHGFSASGLPGSYPGEAEELNPQDEQIVWNAALQRWEITVDIAGFSGFFAGSAGASLLPVRLASFSGRARTTDIALQWHTDSENNVSRFEIKRSGNGVDFNTIGVVTGNNQPLGSSYSFIDPNPLTGNNFYRLNMIDLDETREASKILLISFNRGADIITTVAPNPTRANVTLKLEGELRGMVLLSLYDYSGKLLFNRAISAANSTQSTVEIPTANCSKGVYILQVNANGKVNTHKIIVQ